MHKTKKRMLLWIAVCANDVIRMSSVTCGVAVTWAEMQHGLSMAQVSITIKHHKNLDSKSLSSINTIFSTPTIFQKTPCSNRMEWTGRPANVIIELQTVCKEWSWNPKSLRCAAALAGHPSAVLSTETNVCVILSAEHMSPTAKPLPSSNFGLQLYRSAAVMPHNNSIALCCCYGVTMCPRNKPARPSFTSTSYPRNLWNVLLQFVMLPWSMPSTETVHASPTCLLPKH